MTYPEADFAGISVLVTCFLHRLSYRCILSQSLDSPYLTLLISVSKNTWTRWIKCMMAKDHEDEKRKFSLLQRFHLLTIHNPATKSNHKTLNAFQVKHHFLQWRHSVLCKFRREKQLYVRSMPTLTGELLCATDGLLRSDKIKTPPPPHVLNSWYKCRIYVCYIGLCPVKRPAESHNLIAVRPWQTGSCHQLFHNATKPIHHIHSFHGKVQKMSFCLDSKILIVESKVKEILFFIPGSWPFWEMNYFRDRGIAKHVL